MTEQDSVSTPHTTDTTPSSDALPTDTTSLSNSNMLINTDEYASAGRSPRVVAGLRAAHRATGSTEIEGRPVGGEAAVPQGGGGGREWRARPATPQQPQISPRG